MIIVCKHKYIPRSHQQVVLIRSQSP